MSMFHSVQELKSEFWKVVLLVFFVYSTFTPFFSNESLMIRERFQFNAVEAGRLMAIAGFVMILLIPAIGKISDLYNKRATQILIAICILYISHSYLIAISDCEHCYKVVLPLVTLQIGYGIFMTGIWPAGRLCLTKEHEGLCIGMMTATQNLAYSICPLLIGFTLDHTENYTLGFKLVSGLMLLYLTIALIILSIWWCHGI
mmetsp:Transcript_24629/g.18661  ORF Transcript_24629/g.18661 Transcript_24629/m.18661 type:complete len:202 (+) Transcript_24629:228-833(+)